MKLLAIIIVIFGCQELLGQVKFERQRKIDTLFDADLKLYPDKTFKFSDSRNLISNWYWPNYSGKWQLNEDTLRFTITFTSEDYRRENYDSIIFTTRKYLVKYNKLLEIDGNEKYSWGNFKYLAWGNFKFLATIYGR
jgi:hypothetical protein